MIERLAAWARAWWKASRREGRHYARNIRYVSRHYSPYSAELRTLFRAEALNQPFRPVGPTDRDRTGLVRPYVLAGIG